MAPRGKRRRILLVLSGLVLPAQLAFAQAAMAGELVTPVSPGSPSTDDTKLIYVITLAIAVAIFIVVNAALIYSATTFKRRRGVDPVVAVGTPRTQMKAAGAIGAVAAIVLILGIISTSAVRDVEPTGPGGLTGERAQGPAASADLPKDAAEPLRIEANGRQWIWRYTYPEQETFSYFELVVPRDTTVLLDVTTTDVIHSWWVPGLAGRVMAVPGRSNSTWFKAKRVGIYKGHSAFLSGAGYAAMRTQVRVVTPSEYEAFVSRQRSDVQAAQRALKESAREREDIRAPAPANNRSDGGAENQAEAS